MTAEKKDLISKIFYFVMSSARRKEDGKHLVRHDDGWLVLEDLPLKKLRALKDSVVGQETFENPHGRQSGRILCNRCGVSLEHHKGGTDYAGPVGTCPSTFTWGMVKPFPKITTMSDDDADKALARYWNTESVYEPVR